MGDPVTRNHENHETIRSDCKECRRLFEYAGAQYRTRQPAYTKEEMREAREIRPELRREPA